MYKPKHQNRFGGKPSGNSNSGNRFSRSNSRYGSNPQNRFSKQRPAKGNRNKEIDVTRLILKFKQDQSKAPAAPVHVVTNTFANLNLNPKLLHNLDQRGYVKPTPIQDLAIPAILNKQDVVGVANTGTGKSGAFLLPLLDQILADPNKKALVIVPTRELAVQLDDELRIFANKLSIRSVICVGGMSMGPQVNGLMQKHNFVIGTPGRLKDHVERNNLRLATYTAIVLDEVDRMLDMGFVNDMRFIIGKLPKERQSLFFSATFNFEVEQVMKQFVHDYVKISVKTTETAASINQEIVEVQSTDAKLDRLKELLKDRALAKVIIFVRTKHGADKLGRMLFKDGLRADSIHGDKRQNQRLRTMQAFKSGKINILVATDVAARGLDIAELTHVINYDLPATAEDYTHRIGRVGRGDKKGVALSFVVKDKASSEQSR